MLQTLGEALRVAGRRRRLRQAAAALATIALSATLTGCGFELRQPAELPFTRIALVGFAKASPMVDALRQALPEGSHIVEAPKDAEVVLTALDDHLNRIVAASTSAGQVREFRLRVALKFRLSSPNGKMLLGDTELEQSRDMSYSETAALAKQTEEAVLLREMRADLARQVLRMLAAAGHAAATAAN